MKNLFDTDFYKFIIAEIKQAENFTMIFMMLVSILLFITDILLHLNHINMPDFIRIFYFYSFVLLLYCFVNRLAREYRLKKEKNSCTHKQINDCLQALFPAFYRLDESAHLILDRIINSPENKTYFQYSNKQKIETIENINKEFNNVQQLRIIQTKPALVIEFDKLLKETLKKYFRSEEFQVITRNFETLHRTMSL